MCVCVGARTVCVSSHRVCAHACVGTCVHVHVCVRAFLADSYTKAMLWEQHVDSSKD